VNLTTTGNDSKGYEEKLKNDRAAIQKKTVKTPEELYAEMEKRVRDAIELREPDRVPWVLVGGDETRVSPSASYYDPAAFREAVRSSVLRSEPDLHAATPAATSGLTLEALDPKHMKWPGGTLPPDIPFQSIEQEYMKADEYKFFLADPTDYTLRYLLPRAFGILAPFSKLPSLSDRFTQFPSITPIFATPDFQKLFQILLKAGQDQAKTNQVMRNFSDELADLGFPSLSQGGGVGGAPFDAISDYFRGMRGSMLDMYRQPDKLMAACDKILELRTLKAVPADPAKRGNPKRTYVPLHRGAEGFMSRKQFETFYWPGLKKAMLTTIELGFIPIMVCQGKYDDRLEYLLELPKGKVVAYLHQADMFRAKQILGGHICIMAGLQPGLLKGGSPQEVDDYKSKLIQVCGKGGGFILVGRPPASYKL
jgi:hypothetical protein